MSEKRRAKVRVFMVRLIVRNHDSRYGRQSLEFLLQTYALFLGDLARRLRCLQRGELVVRPVQLTLSGLQFHASLSFLQGRNLATDFVNSVSSRRSYKTHYHDKDLQNSL